MYHFVYFNAKILGHYVLECEYMSRVHLFSFILFVFYRFINCNLGAKEIISMKNMLSKYPNITELFIDRNPFNADNMGLLLDETSSLKFLTLRLCQINDSCVQGIAKQLERVPNSLQILNLSSNYITDLGCEYITNALRINRSLTVLNLSNNFLTDQSCVYFRSALARFELTPNEIKIKRQEHFNRLFLRRKLVSILFFK